jgi:trehalose 6-phosphate phosphatase
MEVLDEIRSRRGEGAIVVDFDGTLSRIAPTPEAARPVAGASKILSALASTYALVAVVSGRRAAEVAGLLGRPSGVRCLGLYGLEDEEGPLGDAAGGIEDRVQAFLPEVERVASTVPGARVEPKGLHVAVHYRAASDPETARRILLERLGALAGGRGLRILEGKKVVELAPPRGPTKGDAVDRLVAEGRLGALLYAGDDVADLAAFAAVRRLAGRGVTTATVAVSSAETPPSLVDQADIVVDGPEELVRLLRRLA